MAKVYVLSTETEGVVAGYKALPTYDDRKAAFAAIEQDLDSERHDRREAKVKRQLSKIKHASKKKKAIMIAGGVAVAAGVGFGVAYAIDRLKKSDADEDVAGSDESAKVDFVC